MGLIYPRAPQKPPATGAQAPINPGFWQNVARGAGQPCALFWGQRPRIIGHRQANGAWALFTGRWARYVRAMTPIEDIYHQRVAQGSLQPDPAQLAALPQLARIAQALEAPQKRTWFSRRKPSPVQGLYLWGGVGRGKSMLMDLFVETLDVPVRRVHFHAFMQEIQSALHEARKTQTADAI